MGKPRDGIVVPETFPHILKTYAKDVIKTQPYDLLSWSAAYFRSIADDFEPPAKARLEENAQPAALTKEYLKILVKQIGKGYFVGRHILQKHWKAIGLPEENLLMMLSACKMVDAERIRWLELLSLLAASISENLESSMQLLLELLTDEEPGGLNSIPLWMFNVIYTFLASLDHSKDFDIESESLKPTIIPTEISTHKLRNAVLSEWKKRVDKPNVNPNVEDEVFNAVMRSTDFEQLIEALQQSEKTMDDVDGEIEIDEQMQMIAIREIGAPFNWIHQFLVHNSSQFMSYNFIEAASESDHELHNHDTDAVASGSQSNTFAGTIPQMPGVGPAIPPETMQKFLEYLKLRCYTTNGLVFPQYFSESDCPPMV